MMKIGKYEQEETEPTETWTSPLNGEGERFAANLRSQLRRNK